MDKVIKKEYDAIIIGAGFSGLYQLHCLRDRLNLKCVILEKGAGVGGTWYWNRYPGARCDTESHAYTYFFSDEIFEEWQWSERYPGHKEIREYLNYVAQKFNLKKDIKFKSEVIKTTYLENEKKWAVDLENSRQLIQFLRHPPCSHCSAQRAHVRVRRSGRHRRMAGAEGQLWCQGGSGA